MNKTQKFWDKQAKRFNDNQTQFEPASQEIISRTKEDLKADLSITRTIKFIYFPPESGQAVMVYTRRIPWTWGCH